MKSQAEKRMKFKCRKIILFSAIMLPMVFAGCKKDNSPPKEKSLEQSVDLSNDVEIKYSATLTNVDKAKLNVKNEGVLISTEEISDVASSGPDYQKTYSYSVNPQIREIMNSLLLQKIKQIIYKKIIM